MDSRLILNLACTGMVPTKRQNPALPETPEEIARDVRRCRERGASIVHLHARIDGVPTYRKESYANIIAAVREACPDIVVCVSCSGRNFPALEQRAEVLELDGDLKPEMASLTLGSLNFPRQASVTDPAMIAGLAERMQARGIVPELEVFDLGMLEVSHYLLRKKVLRPPLYYNILLGSLGTASLSPLNLGTLLAALPEGATWALAGIGRFQLAANTMAISAGGHIRVGLEDNLYFDSARTKPATNAMLVERAATIARLCEREPATPAEARALIGLAQR